MIELWSGNLSCENGTLRLLLILDYILDWARDLYRPTIIRELKTLAHQEPPLIDAEILQGLHRFSTELAETRTLASPQERTLPHAKPREITAENQRPGARVLDSKSTSTTSTTGYTSLNAATSNTSASDGSAARRISDAKRRQPRVSRDPERDQPSLSRGPISSRRYSKPLEEPISEGRIEKQNTKNSLSSSKSLAPGRTSLSNPVPDIKLAAANHKSRELSSTSRSLETNCEGDSDLEGSLADVDSSEPDEGTYSSDESSRRVLHFRTPLRSGTGPNTPLTEPSLRSVESTTTVDSVEHQDPEIYTPTRASRKADSYRASTLERRRREFSSPL